MTSPAPAPQPWPTGPEAPPTSPWDMTDPDPQPVPDPWPPTLPGPPARVLVGAGV